MDFFTVEGTTFEEALSAARKQYGEGLRILNRRQTRATVFAKQKCVITCYMVDVPKIEPVVEEPEKAGEREEKEEVLDCFAPDDRQTELLIEPQVKVKGEPSKEVGALLDRAQELLKANSFTDGYIQKLKSDLRLQLEAGLPSLPDNWNFEMLILDNIVSGFESDHSTQLYPPKYFVLSGMGGVGKSTAARKIAYLFSRGLGKKVEVIGLKKDFAETQATDPVCDRYGIRYSSHSCYSNAAAISESGSEIYIIDSFAVKQPSDQIQLNSFYAMLPPESTDFFIVTDPDVKSREIERLFAMFPLINFKSLIISKVDESSKIGNILSLCSEYGLPVLFLLGANDAVANIQFASSYAVLSKLRNFTVDIGNLMKN